MDSTAVLERYGTRLAIAGNVSECPLMMGIERPTDQAAEIAAAMVERATATVH
jgi:hypothetical protein